MAWAYTFAVLVITDADKWRQNIVLKFVNGWHQRQNFLYQKSHIQTLNIHFWYLKFITKMGTPGLELR